MGKSELDELRDKITSLENKLFFFEKELKEDIGHEINEIRKRIETYIDGEINKAQEDIEKLRKRIVQTLNGAHIDENRGLVRQLVDVWDDCMNRWQNVCGSGRENIPKPFLPMSNFIEKLQKKFGL